MRAILPLDLLDFDQPEIRLVDQRGSLQRVAGTLVAHMAPGQAAQFPMDEGQQAVERRVLTPPPRLQQTRWGRARDWECADSTPGATDSAAQILGLILTELTIFDAVLASTGEDRLSGPAPSSTTIAGDQP